MASISSVAMHLYAIRHEILFLAIACYCWLEWRSYRRLRNFKGPVLARFSNLYMANIIGTKKANLQTYAVTQKYGDLARVGPNILLTCDPERVMRMSSARSKYTRAKWYSGQKVEVDHDNMFSMTDDKLHAKRRAQLATGYAGKGIDGLEATIDKHLLQYVKLITEKYVSVDAISRPMDLARKSGFWAMDIITDIAFGRPWGCLVRDEDVAEWFKSMELAMPTAIRASTIPWLAYFFSIPVVGKLIMPSENDPTGAGRMLGIAKEIVYDRFSQPDSGAKKDMMGSFIRHGLTRTEAVTEATLQIIAGGDTTATSIRATMLFVITNIQVYKALQAEIDAFSPRGSIITDEEAKRLPYLQAVIKEGARIWPVATGLMSKVVPPEGDTFNGIFIPGGTEIGQCAWSIQRSKKVYGEDSSIFRPERWLQAEGEELETMEKTLGLLWGFGKYSCLGKNIAMVELNKIYFTLLKHFDFALIDPSNPWVSENYSLWMQKDMFVRVTSRSGKSM